jgi:hypothetical protein
VPRGHVFLCTSSCETAETKRRTSDLQVMVLLNSADSYNRLVSRKD